MAWQTMDSAPQDGTRIILSDGQYVAIGRNSDQIGGWTMELDDYVDHKKITEKGYWVIPPVQWQPIPVPEPFYEGAREANPNPRVSLKRPEVDPVPQDETKTT
jgi:hypothetical protein